MDDVIEKVDSINEKQAELKTHILAYESDTFSASETKITELEAMEISENVLVCVMNDLINNQHADQYLDGVTIAQYLDELRHPEDY